jgi:hypothetical protein
VSGLGGGDCAVRQVLDDVGLRDVWCHVLVDDEHEAGAHLDCHESPLIVVEGRDLLGAAGVDPARDPLVGAFIAPSGLPEPALLRYLLTWAAQLL